jgi:hypothetical protein
MKPFGKDTLSIKNKKEALLERMLPSFD